MARDDRRRRHRPRRVVDVWHVRSHRRWDLTGGDTRKAARAPGTSRGCLLPHAVRRVRRQALRRLGQTDDEEEEGRCTDIDVPQGARLLLLAAPIRATLANQKVQTTRRIPRLTRGTQPRVPDTRPTHVRDWPGVRLGGLLRG